MGIHVVQYIEKAVRSDGCFIPYIHDLIHFGDELLHELQVLVQVYTGLH